MVQGPALSSKISSCNSSSITIKWWCWAAQLMIEYWPTQITMIKSRNTLSSILQSIILMGKITIWCHCPVSTHLIWTLCRVIPSAEGQVTICMLRAVTSMKKWSNPWVHFSHLVATTETVAVVLLKVQQQVTMQTIIHRSRWVITQEMAHKRNSLSRLSRRSGGNLTILISILLLNHTLFTVLIRHPTSHLLILRNRPITIWWVLLSRWSSLKIEWVLNPTKC